MWSMKFSGNPRKKLNNAKICTNTFGTLLRQITLTAFRESLQITITIHRSSLTPYFEINFALPSPEGQVPVPVPLSVYRIIVESEISIFVIVTLHVLVTARPLVTPATFVQVFFAHGRGVALVYKT